MADMNGSGNWLTNLSDAWNTITGQPVVRPGQFSDQFMNSVTNSRGSMYPGPARLTPNVGNYVDPNAQGGGGMMPGQVPGIGSYSSLDWGNSPPPLSSTTIPVQYPAGNAPWGTTSRNMAFNILNGLPYDRGVVGLPKKPAAPDTSFPKTAVRYKTAIGPQMGTVGGKQPVTKVAATMKPGYQRGNGLLAFLTQNNKQPMSGGLSGLLSSLFQQPATAVGSQLDTQPSRSDRYTLDTLPTFSGPRSGVATNGYVYQNGQNIGTTRPAGVGPAQYDAMINAAAKARAQANATSGYTQSENSWFNEVTGR